MLISIDPAAFVTTIAPGLRPVICENDNDRKPHCKKCVAGPCNFLGLRRTRKEVNINMIPSTAGMLLANLFLNTHL